MIDITYKLNSGIIKNIFNGSESNIGKLGHLGTHFDVMDKKFPLEYTKRKGIIFDVSSVKDRDIDISDINEDKISADSFVIFYTNFIEEFEYASKEYFSNHPQLSYDLINLLIEKQVSIIGLDFAGMRRNDEHPVWDKKCADNNIFAVENLCNLKQILNLKKDFIVNTYPMNFEGFSGLPCRVIVEN